MKQQNKLTWLSYFDLQKLKKSESGLKLLADFDTLFQAKNIVNAFFRYGAPYAYILDYKKRTYINASENICGYKADSFLQGGVDHTLEIYDPKHLRLLNNEIFPDRLKFLSQIKPEEHKDYVFSFIQNVRNRKGENESILQRNIFLSDEHGDPVFSVGFLLNIKLHSYNQPIIQYVDKLSSDGLLGTETIFQKSYYIYEEDKLFTKREKEVLKWMADGLSSKMIADRMFVSEYTIINHRRNMQQKSNTENSIALVCFAIRNGVI